MRFRLLFIFALFLTSCVYGPTVEHKSVLNNLNGENYATTQVTGPDTLIVPFAKTKERITVIKGQLVIQDETPLPTPLRFTALILSNEKGEILQKGSTSANGEFVFSGIFPNGTYSIKIDSKRYTGSQNFEIKSYSIDKLIVQGHLIK